MQIDGFDWDDGNWPKCSKHGLSREEIEQALTHRPFIMPDPYQQEPRLRAIGKTEKRRYVFLVFMLRQIDDQTKIRPISARYMHKKEIDHYEQQIKKNT